MWKTELYVIVTSAESLTQGSTSVNDSVTPFSVTVELSAPASETGAQEQRSCCNEECQGTPHRGPPSRPSKSEHYLAPGDAISSLIGSQRGVANDRPSS